MLLVHWVKRASMTSPRHHSLIRPTWGHSWRHFFFPAELNSQASQRRWRGLMERYLGHVECFYCYEIHFFSFLLCVFFSRAVGTYLSSCVSLCVGVNDTNSFSCVTLFFCCPFFVLDRHDFMFYYFSDMRCLLVGSWTTIRDSNVLHIRWLLKHLVTPNQHFLPRV